jgi:hypothetical protein
MPEACDTGGPDWGSDWGHPRTRAARPWAILDVVNHDKRSGTMTEINVIVTGPEEAYDNEAEFWLADVASLARSLAEAEQRLSAY